MNNKNTDAYAYAYTYAYAYDLFLFYSIRLNLIINIYLRRKFNNYRIYNIFYDLNIPGHFLSVSALCIHPTQARMPLLEYLQFL